MTTKDYFYVLTMGLITAILLRTYVILNNVADIVQDIKQEFVQEGKELAKEGALYLKEEYAPAARELTEEIIDSTRNNLIQIFKQKENGKN